MPPFDAINACVFDAFGTLFDVHSAVGRHRTRLGEHADAVSALWRSKQLEYTWLHSLMTRHADFWQITGNALDYALDVYGIRDPALRDDLMAAYLTLDCYPEVPTTLTQLKDAGLQLAILSNGTPELLDAAVTSARLEGLFNACLSVEEVGIYKPNPRVYHLAVERLGIPSEAIAFLSSNAWDIAGAASFGFRTIWVNRFCQPRERLPYGPAAEIATLAELPSLLGI